MSRLSIFKNEWKEDGTFEYQKSLFQKAFGYSEGELKPEADRYRLIWMPACPHSHKIIIVIHLLGLDDAISIGMCGPYRSENGWVFSEDPGGKDPITGVSSLQTLYLNADPNYDSRPTVPAMVDTKTNKVVNNDNYNLSIQLETVWSDFHKKDAPDLYPQALQNEIDNINQIIYEEINWGVYKVGFSTHQKAYEEAYDRFFEVLDQFESHLQGRKYLFGDELTDSDVRLYTTLVRFDSVYNILFRANKKRLIEYPNLHRYTKNLYEIEAFSSTTNFDLIKKSYYLSPHLRELFGNEAGILPIGPAEKF